MDPQKVDASGHGKGGSRERGVCELMARENEHENPLWRWCAGTPERPLTPGCRSVESGTCL